MIIKRNVVVCIILGICTCGIYNLYWMSQITNNVADIKRDNNYRTGGSVVLYTIITCGIYGFYWVYTTSRDIYYLEQDYEMRTSDNTAINLVLAIFTGNLVSLAIMQSSINNLSDEIQSA